MFIANEVNIPFHKRFSVYLSCIHTPIIIFSIRRSNIFHINAYGTVTCNLKIAISSVIVIDL